MFWFCSFRCLVEWKKIFLEGLKQPYIAVCLHFPVHMMLFISTLEMSCFKIIHLSQVNDSLMPRTIFCEVSRTEYQFVYINLGVSSPHWIRNKYKKNNYTLEQVHIEFECFKGLKNFLWIFSNTEIHIGLSIEIAICACWYNLTFQRKNFMLILKTRKRNCEVTYC